MNRGELQRPAWTGDPLISGGFLYETPIHMLDLVRHLFGEPADVVCRARATSYEQLDDFSMLFTFESGISAVFATSAHATWLFPFERVEVYGEHAIDRHGGDGADHLRDRRRPGGADARFRAAGATERWGYVEEDGRFVDALCGVSEPAVSAAEALATTELVERCYAAAREASAASS